MKDLYGNDDIEAMYRAALAMPLDAKIEQAVTVIRSHESIAIQMSSDGFYNCNSGGKDSGVTGRLMEMAGVRHESHYSNVTIDPPELVHHLKRTYPDTIWHSVGIPLPLYMAKKAIGPPTRNCRWCCEIYKENGGNGSFKVVGVRADESARRKGLWRQIRHDPAKSSIMLSPILYWTEKDVWEFTHGENIPYCELYDEGFKRLGCVGCPLAGPVHQRMEFARWPKYELLWQRGFRAHWDRYKDQMRRDGTERWSNFKTWEDLWEWWLGEYVEESTQPDCQMFLW